MDGNLDAALSLDLANGGTALPTGPVIEQIEGTLLKIFTIVLLATAACAGAANARGGGGAETMPLTNYTDMPSYHPRPVACLRIKCGKRAHWHRSPARDD